MTTTTTVLFNGIGLDSELSLWDTNGTSGGTSELVVAGVDGTGLDPQYITSFNGVALLEGQDSHHKFGLWVTNGTGGGTTEIGGFGSVNIAHANPDGLAPGYFHVYNGFALFRGEAGLAGAEVPGLWITNGTVAGTSEVGGAKNAGIKNAYSGGLLPSDPDFTTLNGKVLFRGRDSKGEVGLWVTNGIAAGTVELAPIAGAAFGPTAPPTGYDVQPNYMAVMGGEVVFDGADQEDTEGSLWVTNGTVGGTMEVGGQGNRGILEAPFRDPAGDLPIGIAPYDITAFNGKVLFAGTDDSVQGNGHYTHAAGLWISNGTAAGTAEIGGLGNLHIANANPSSDGGIFWEGSVAHPDITVFKNKALFIGLDASPSVHIGLWVTDGTAGGTVEIGGLGNALVAGGLHFATSENPDFTVFGNEVLFNALDSSNFEGLWETDGTAAGTKEIAVATAPSLTPTDLTVFTNGPSLSVSSVSHTSPSGTHIKAGEVVGIKLVMSEAAVVTGTPKLLLNDGGVASYLSGSGTGTLVFKYVVAAGQNTADLKIAGSSLVGATIKDHNGFNGVLSGAVNADLGVSVDTIAPTVVSEIVSHTGGSTLHIGDKVTITLTMSEAVTEASINGGVPVLEFAGGLTARYDAAATASLANSSKVVFDYIVASGQSSPDLQITVPSFAGGAIRDAAGNNANLTVPNKNLGLRVDGIRPAVTTVTATPATGDLLSGDVTITLTMSKPVTVGAGVTLTLNDGGVAHFVNSPTSNTLVFDYHVGTESTTDLAVTGINQAGGSIVDADGNAALSTLSADLKLKVNVFSFAKTQTGGDWNTAGNWTPSAVPTGADTAVLGGTGTYTVTSAVTNIVGALDTAGTATLSITGGIFTATKGTGIAASAGAIRVANGATLKLGGTFDNTGTIRLLGSSSATDLKVVSALTLAGAGKVILSDSTDSGILSNGSAVTLTNAANTISGGGQIGDANLSLVNKGTIIGNGVATALTINGTLSNSGILEGATAQGLVLAKAVTNSKTIAALGSHARVLIESSVTEMAAAAVIVASGAGAHVDIGNGVTVSGGMLRTVGAGAQIDVVAGSATLTGVSVVAGSVVEALSGTTLTLGGTDANAGTLVANGGRIDITGTVSGGVTTIAGGGTVEIAAASSAEAIRFAMGASSVTNQLVLDHSQAFHGTVSGFGANGNIVESIDLKDLNFATFNPATDLTYTPTTAANTSGVLKVTDGTHTANIKLVGTYTTAMFHAVNDGSNHIKITDPPVAAAAPSLDATAALLRNYMASAALAADHSAATAFTASGQIEAAPLLAHPHS